MKFIYVTDEQTKNQFIVYHFNLLQERTNNNNPIWIFENNQTFNFDLFDKTKYVLTNQLVF